MDFGPLPQGAEGQEALQHMETKQTRYVSALLCALAAMVVVGCAGHQPEPPAEKSFTAGGATVTGKLTYKAQADGTYAKAECTSDPAHACDFIKKGSLVAAGLCDVDNPIGGKFYCYSMPLGCHQIGDTGMFDCTLKINAANACLADEDCVDTSSNATCRASQCLFFAFEDPSASSTTSTKGQCNLFAKADNDPSIPAAKTCGVGACASTAAYCSGGVYNANPTCTPGQPAGGEVCDNIDNTCNGATDEGCDDDKDLYCDATMTMGSSGSTACSKGGADCNDTVAGINPGVTVETCNDVDETCNGKVDEGCDDDVDGYCDATMTTAGGSVKSCPSGAGDCDDKDATRHPNASEWCDNIDSNCDGKSDTGDNVYKMGEVCTTGIGECGAAGKMICDTDKKASHCDATAKPTPLPTSEKDCDNKDNDCDGYTDEACDSDNDDYCDANMILSSSGSSECPKGGGDCLDKGSLSAKNIYPTAKEACNGGDDNCNGAIDEPTGATTTTCGQGACMNTVPWCASGMTPNCSPKASVAEVCGNSVDDDCDGTTDESDACGICESSMPLTCKKSTGTKFDLSATGNEELFVQALCPTSGGNTLFKVQGKKQVINVNVGPKDTWSFISKLDAGFTGDDFMIVVQKASKPDDCKADADQMFSDAIKDTFTEKLCFKGALKNFSGTGPARLILVSPTNKAVTGTFDLACVVGK